MRAGLASLGDDRVAPASSRPRLRRGRRGPDRDRPCRARASSASAGGIPNVKLKTGGGSSIRTASWASNRAPVAAAAARAEPEALAPRATAVASPRPPPGPQGLDQGEQVDREQRLGERAVRGGSARN